jgi:hypothetical protein
MSDGENTFSGNLRAGGWSDYSAYGYISHGRTGSSRFDNSATFLDERMKLACANAKGRGITIITILFRESSQRATDALRNCATSPKLAYRANDKASLAKAFQDIADQIASLRIAR